MPAYPLATPPSRVVRMEEADERLLAVKGAIHDFVSSSCTSGKKGTGAGRGCEQWEVHGGVPGGEALTVTLRFPRAPAGDPLLAERPARVAAEGANPFIKERRDCNKIMLIRPQQAHESSTNASSACWKPRHWRQRSCPSSADRKRPQPEGHGRNGILKKTRSSEICSFRICSLSWSAQGNRWWEGLRWSHRYANQEQNKDERLCGDQHSSTWLRSKNLISGCTCRLFIPVCTGSGSGMQNPLANFIGIFSLVRDDRGFQVNPLCRHDITRSDRQIGNSIYSSL